MLIGKRWKVEADNQNIILYKYHKHDSGIVRWSAEGYFSSVAGALKFLVSQQVEETQLKDLQTVAAKIESLEKKIDAALQKSPPQARQTARKGEHGSEAN